MPWTLKKKLDDFVSANGTNIHAKCLQAEIDRINVQVCGYCDGWGHSGNDCPTDAKLFLLRQGIAEQRKIIIQLRKECRAAAGMSGVKGFSLLSAKSGRI